MTEQLEKSEHLSELQAQKVKMSRRNILKLTAFAGAGAIAAATPFVGAAAQVEAAGDTATFKAQAVKDQIGFEPISPTTADELVLAKGFRYNVIRSWGDFVAGGDTFGFNNDYIAYFPIDFLQGGNSSSDGLLWVNHEYPSPMFISNRPGNVDPTFEQLIKEKAAVGGTVMRIKKNAGGVWEFVDDPTYNRRISGWTLIDLDGPAAGSPAVFGYTTVQGTVGNCAGGYTPWGTALSAEENYQDYAPSAAQGGYGWGKSDKDDRFFVEEHYGWVVEIDPFEKDARPVKHTALGRFRHENATVAIGSTGKVVVYSGYDRADYPVFKFISDGTYNPTDRAANKKMLSSGKLYAANFGTGRWIELTPNNAAIAARYKTVPEMLVNAGEAAILAGATRTDRPEDIKISPLDKKVYISFTNNTGHGNFHGHITRLTEGGNDPEALVFDWEIFAQGGPQVESNFSSPDNLEFDLKGNLWVFCDVSSSSAAKGIYRTMGNNGIYVIPTTGEYAGVAFRFGSGPIECETTGPCWTPDRKTLFVAVQHPGEESSAMDKLTSHWPGGGDSVPKPAIVAITGF